MLIQSIKKEAIIIANDLHSLAVLILLPITFMVIMTFAMGEKHENLIKKINIEVLATEQSSHSSAFILYLQNSGFQINAAKKFDASIEFQTGFDQTILTRSGDGYISLAFVDDLSPQTRNMITELVKATLAKLKLHAYMLDGGELDEDLSLAEKVAIVEASASVDYLLHNTEQKQLFLAPTLYSIPSWLIFGIYFIVLPISTTLIKEKQNGTLLRIQTYPISTHYYFFNKALSYSVVSFFQWVLLCLVGFIFVPWLTDQAYLQINNVSLYLLAALFIIFGAIGFAFLLASMVSTYEQAIVLGGGVNILIAALSGFMVPIDIMPEFLAKLATFSPMYWSAELVKLALSGASIDNASHYLVYLSLFGGVCFISALCLFNFKGKQLSWT